MGLIRPILYKDAGPVFCGYDGQLSTMRSFQATEILSLAVEEVRSQQDLSEGRQSSLPFSQLQLLLAPQPLMLLGPAVAVGLAHPRTASSFLDRDSRPALTPLHLSAKPWFPDQATLAVNPHSQLARATEAQR